MDSVYQKGLSESDTGAETSLQGNLFCLLNA